MKYFFLVPFLIIFSNSTAQNDNKLEKTLLSKTKNFKGDVGIYVENIKTGKTVKINAEDIFPTASMIKVPIMLGVFSDIISGKLSYNQEITYRDSLKYDDGVVGSLKDGSKMPLAEMILLMETISDNTASLWLQGMVSGERINYIMDSLGLEKTRVNSRTAGRNKDWKLYGWGQTTPIEMATIMKSLRKGDIFSKDASNRMYRTLGNQFYDGEGLSQIPEHVKTYCKTGAVNASRSEVVFVHAPHGEYLYCIITKNQVDQSWTRENEGYELIREVSKTLWNYFEPKSKWKPVEGYEKW